MTGASVGWAILGAGRFASGRMVPAIARSQHARIRGVWARQPEAASRLAASLGSRAYPDVADVAADRSVDVVYVCATPSAHPALVMTLLTAGKHILCEKPIATTQADAKAIADLADRVGVRCFVNHHVRANSCVAKLRSLIAAGALGSVRAAALVNEQLLPLPGGWRVADRRDGGVVLDLTVHDVDLVTHLFGAPTVLGASVLDRIGPIESQIVAMLGCGGVPVLLRDGWITDPLLVGHSTLLVVGEVGTALLEPAVTAAESRLQLRARGRSVVWTQEGDAYAQVPELVTRAIFGEQVALSTAADAVATLGAIDTIRTLVAGRTDARPA